MSTKRLCSERMRCTWPRAGCDELMATAPQVWSWASSGAITTSTSSWTSTSWAMVADRENSALAGRLIQQSCLKHGVQPRVLTLHSDRGAPMTSQCTAQLLADLGVRSLSRPQVSDDNPFCSVQNLEVPSLVCLTFYVRWYNAEHRRNPRERRQVIAGDPCSAVGRSEVCRSPNRSRRPSSPLPSPHRIASN